jgi:hypothetical protein
VPLYRWVCRRPRWNGQVAEQLDDHKPAADDAAPQPRRVHQDPWLLIRVRCQHVLTVPAACARWRALRPPTGSDSNAAGSIPAYLTVCSTGTTGCDVHLLASTVPCSLYLTSLAGPCSMYLTLLAGGHGSERCKPNEVTGADSGWNTGVAWQIPNEILPIPSESPVTSEGGGGQAAQ